VINIQSKLVSWPSKTVCWQLCGH